ncbi:MAG: Uma2 family endonuclease, partial [Chloroflexota bacterium]
SFHNLVSMEEFDVARFGGLLYLMGEKNDYLRSAFAPDISFIRNENIPADWNLSLPFPSVPDLAVEVMSPSDSAEDIQAKIRVYLDKGTAQVWVIYPSTRELHQYQRGQPMVRIYSGKEQIDTESLFPGFILTLETIFKLPPWMEKLNLE